MFAHACLYYLNATDECKTRVFIVMFVYLGGGLAVSFLFINSLAICSMLFFMHAGQDKCE